MIPVQFEGANLTLGKDQPEYLPLPCMFTNDGIVVSAWKLSDDELEVLMKTKTVWLSQLTFGQPLQPQLPPVDCPVHL